MSAYCTCTICQASPAQPAAGTASTAPEIVRGGLVTLGANDVLVHWSGARFADLMSTELADIQVRGVNPIAVCASFYLYRGNPGPATRPPVLAMMGLGGNFRYEINATIAAGASIYSKSATPGAGTVASPIEVVVVLGCGGHIRFPGVAGAGFPGETAQGIFRNEDGRTRARRT